MALARSVLVSTASLVIVRAAGVAARALSLLTLAAAMPAERFGHYATAFVLSELARCLTDFGLDPLVLRRAEGRPSAEQRAIVRAALAVRAAHGAVTAGAVLGVLALMFRLDLLLVAAALQFVPQGWLQLALNQRQVSNSAQRVAPALLGFYAVVAGLAALAWVRPAWGGVPLPLLLVGEALAALALLGRAAMPRGADLVAGYRTLVRAALPMAGIALLALVNTRTDALLVGRLLSSAEAGRYLYLARWVDFAPMLASGVALPLVGKLGGFDVRRQGWSLAAAGIVLAAVPFALVELAAALKPPYAADPLLRALLAAASVCRIGLAVTTTLLLAKWRDAGLGRVAAVTSALLPLLVWLLGSRLGAHGVVAGVLAAETANLLFQSVLLLRGPRPSPWTPR